MADLAIPKKDKDVQKTAVKIIELLGFYVEGELFGLPLKEVLEVLRSVEPVPVPFSSPLIKGIINVRGELIPVLDLKSILNLKTTKKEERIIILESPRGKAGVLVDEVYGVIRLNEESLEPNPMVGMYSKFVRNVAYVDGTLISILEFDRIAESV
ncbi:MAG: purine-binding chemotaxis protein CheW [Thermocrinis sp.]|nr:purine-binding chemotaxis protein CheW [Thermocrinis sp.]